jgi:CheY-like chemotaxis protein
MDSEKRANLQSQAMKAANDENSSGARDRAEVVRSSDLLSEAETNILKNATVLVAEDNAINQIAAEGMLEDLGVRVFCAPDGARAVEAVLAGGVDLVLMDCQMPVMDGFEATRAIRESERGSGRRLPIVAMTAAAARGDRERCVAAGMDDHLSKPIQPDELRRVILERLGARPRTGTDPSTAG